MRNRRRSSFANHTASDWRLRSFWRLWTALVGPLLIDWGNHRALFESRSEPAHRRQCAGDRRHRARVCCPLRGSYYTASQSATVADTIRARHARCRVRARFIDARRMARRRGASCRAANQPRTEHFRPRSRAEACTIAFKPDELSVDRLSIEDGTVTLTDAASGASVTPGSRSVQR